MAETRFTMKKGDTLPILEVTLYDGVGAVVDLTDAVSFALNILPTGTVGIPFIAAAEVYGLPESGIVRYHWPTPQTMTTGVYDAEIQVTWSTGDIETYPNVGYFQIVIMPQLE